jgi:hypothetical protein
MIYLGWRSHRTCSFRMVWKHPVAVARIDSIASDYDDKCPFVTRNIMVFTSNRPGGMGGFDLYYSIYKNGAWGSPVNFGPGINSECPMNTDLFLDITPIIQTTFWYFPQTGREVRVDMICTLPEWKLMLYQHL